MRLWLSVFVFFIGVSASAQSREFFAISDSCTTYELFELDSNLLIKEIHRCEGYSVIEQVTRSKNMYSRNGFYKEFSDTSFVKLKRTGTFINGIEAGVWKQYYSNGNLEYQGELKRILLTVSKDYKNVRLLNMENASDTMVFALSVHKLDSIKQLAIFNYYPQFEIEGYMFPLYYSLKDGDWLYYSEQGKFVRRERFKMGKLVSSE